MRRTILCILALVLLVGICVRCAPVMPQRSKLGGAARWAYDVSRQPAALWAKDAQLCRIVGVGVGAEGWLPDRGGNWILTWASAASSEVLEVSVDSDGNAQTKNIPDSPHRADVVPADWKDSSTVWTATRSHQRGVPLNTFTAELSSTAGGEEHEGMVWRIRYYLTAGGFETHFVSAQGEWLSMLED